VPSYNSDFITSFCGTVASFIRDRALWNFRDPIIVAVSGGPDSIVLLHVLLRLTENSKALVVAHFDHVARAGSDRDRHFVMRTTRQLGLDFVSGILDISPPPGCSMESFWRSSRYRFLEDARLRFHAVSIATGHTADDQIETVFMRLIAGSGPRGILGIRCKTNDHLIRPLLRTSRTDILEYLRIEKLRYRKDPSNNEMHHPRNFFRWKIAPLIRKMNPCADLAIASFVDLMSAEDDFISAAACERVNASLIECDYGLTFQTDSFRSMHSALLRRIAAEILRRKTTILLDRPTRRIIDNLCAFLRGLRRTVTISRRLRGELSGHRGYIFRIPHDIEIKPIQVNAPGTTRFGIYSIETVNNVFPELFTDANCYYLRSSVLPLRIRTRSAGDAIEIPDRRRKVALNRLFVEKQVPAGLRDSIPVIVGVDDEIIAVPGIAVNPAALPQNCEETMKITWKVA
jgi:tRNA(Ile)-lysidine synthase